MAVSVVFLAFLGTFVTRRYVMPRLGEGPDSVKTAEIPKLTAREKRGKDGFAGIE